MTKVTVSSTGQITLPAELTDPFQLKAGDEVSVDVQGDVLILHLPRPVVHDIRFGGPVHDVRDWRSMRGMVKGGESLTKALEEEHRAELAREDARLR